MMSWLEERKVILKVDGNNKVFPKSDTSQTIIDCFMKDIEKKGIEVRYNQIVNSIKNIIQII